MAVHYRHTQIGWVILAVMIAVGAFARAQLPGPPATPSVVPVLVVIVLVASLFASLTVEVDEEAVRLRFGIGLVRKTIGLADVRAWHPVRNPWYCGWGIRFLPRGVLWNVSGFDAVELALPDGRRFRVGTDEPEALADAIAQARGFASPAPPSDSGTGTTRRRSGASAALAVLVGALLLGAILWVFRSQVQPPGVTVGPQGFEVRTPFYGQSFAADDVTAISLEAQIPRVLARTNGFAGAGALRGHFRVEGLGEGRLYVEEGCAPYVVVRLARGFVILNFREPERTEALYEEMARAWPDRAVPAAP